jgi:hypothetical protein
MELSDQVQADGENAKEIDEIWIIHKQEKENKHARVCSPSYSRIHWKN